MCGTRPGTAARPDGYQDIAAHEQLTHQYDQADVGGNITQTVTATGTINPVALINVGSQVSGTVVELKADFNDHVKKGQVLLKLDPTIFNAQIRQVEASVASAHASMRLEQANFDRNQRLVAQNYVSALTLDQSRRRSEPGSTSSSGVSSEALAVARRATLVMPRPRARSTRWRCRRRRGRC